MLVVVVPALLPSAFSRVRRRPGMPSSSANTVPLVPMCVGEKSRQARPTTAPDAADGTAACCACSVCKVNGLMPVKPSRATPPPDTAALVTSAPPAPGARLVEASVVTDWPADLSMGYRPGGLNTSLAVCRAALTMPMCGSRSKTSRQIRADAVALNTMGMNRTVLNAVDQRMRSLSTANTRPRKVTMKGKTMTQMTLLRSPMRMSSVAKMSL